MVGENIGYEDVHNFSTQKRIAVLTKILKINDNVRNDLDFIYFSALVTTEAK